MHWHQSLFWRACFDPRLGRLGIRYLIGFFRPLDSSDPEARQEPVSVKKLLKGDACWTTRKQVLGWLNGFVGYSFVDDTDLGIYGKHLTDHVEVAADMQQSIDC
jgi:hypothetical protein